MLMRWRRDRDNVENFGRRLLKGGWRRIRWNDAKKI
jgi:hypothetical protein